LLFSCTGYIVLDSLAGVKRKKSKEVQEIPEVLNCIRKFRFSVFLYEN